MSDVLTGAASGAVIIVNAAVQFSMRKLAKLEKHHNFEHSEESLATRIFILLFLNTGIVVLVTNSQLFSNLDLLAQFAANCISDTRKDFSTGWYEQVGSTITLIMCFTVFTIHFAPTFRYVRAQRRRKAQSPMCVTQNQLNELYTGPEFHLSSRYAQLLNIIFVTLLFGSGIPVLYFTGAVAMLVAFWYEKKLFASFYRTPPQYNEVLGRQTTAMLPYAAMMHLLMAMWMFGNQSIFVSTEYDSDSSSTIHTSAKKALDLAFLSGGFPLSAELLKQQHVWPLLVTFTVLISLLVLNRVKNGVCGILSNIISCLTCGHFHGLSPAEVRRLNKVSISYSDALEHDRIKAQNLDQVIAKEPYIMNGLTSYNILENRWGAGRRHLQ
jgi:hypothetical protein